MRNIAFSIWMVGYPICCTLDSYVNEYLLNHVDDATTNGITAFIVLFIWIFVGILLYEKKPKVAP
jgi:peptidoglycan/LPS O-acetylase OafA/YrhL